MTEAEHNDFSPYELVRLERIKRNENRLRQLGLFKPTANKPTPKPRSAATGRKRKQIPSAPTRSSRRLRKLRDDKDNSAAEEEEGHTNNDDDTTPADKESVLSYERMPNEPEQLDDEEFQVYVSLKAWRLKRKNELEIEPYKICQNKTLCNIIRRRRNDANFAMGEDTALIEKDLLSVWGIGPSKATEGGFGWEMLEVLNTSQNEVHLILSRKNDKKEDL